MEGKIIDNKQYGRVGDVLKRNIKENSKLSIIASYFTLYAFDELKEELSKIDSLRFIYTEPTFVNNDNKNIMKKIKENENKWNILKNKESIRDAIQRRISGQVTTPYKDRFIFYYATDEEIRQYFQDDKAIWKDLCKKRE